MSCQTKFDDRRMDKLVHDDKGNTTISATIMKLLDIVHHAAKSSWASLYLKTLRLVMEPLVHCNGAFSRRVFLEEAKHFIEDRVHPQCITQLSDIIKFEGKILEEKKSLLVKRAATTLSSKLIGGERFFCNHGCCRCYCN